MFSQVDPSAGGAGGLGIGLNIAQRLAVMHGGIIAAESEGVGKGSVFTLRLPLTPDLVEADPAARNLLGDRRAIHPHPGDRRQPRRGFHAG
jgi:hypothetical protein